MNSTTPNTPQPDALEADVRAHAPPSEIVETIDGREFHFRPLRVKQFFPFLAIARPLFAALAKASSPPAPGLPPAPADGQGGEPSAPPVPDLAAMVGNTDAILELLETEGQTAIRALAIALEPDQAPEAQAAMVDALEDLTLVGLLVAFKHFVVLNAGFFAAQGLRLPQGGLLGAPMAPTDADRARAGAAAAAQRPGATRPRKR